MAVDGSEKEDVPTSVGGHHEEEQGAAKHDTRTSRRSSFRALIQDFGPLWFTWCMNSGILGTLCHQLPYQFHGLQIIATIFFVLDLVLYLMFSVIYILHFAIYRRRAYDELLDNVVDLCLLPCWCIALMTLVSFVALPLSNAPWGGHHFTILAVVMWWIAAAWVLGLLVFVFCVLIQRHTILERQLPTLIIIPAVGVATLAAIGGIVTCFAHDISAGLAVPIIITSICANGVGMFLGLILCTFLFYQLLAKGWPAPPQTATIFILLGPMGQCSAALQLLGRAADIHFAAYNRGFFLDARAAYAFHAACLLLALSMTGLGAVWLTLAFCAMIDRVYHRQLVWAPTWNAIIFPTATMTTSTLLLGSELDSPFFRIVTVILVIFMIIVFLLNIVFTIAGIAKGQILVVRDDPRLKKKLDERPKAS